MFRHIRSKLIAAFAVPLAILVAVATAQSVSSLSQISSVDAQTSLASASVGPGGLVQALQTEREYGELTVFGGAVNPANALNGFDPAAGGLYQSPSAIQNTTDKAVTAFRNSVESSGPKVAAIYQSALTSLNSLQAARAYWVHIPSGRPTVKNYQMRAIETYIGYSTVIDGLINATAQVPQQITDPVLRTGVEALYASLENTETQWQTLQDMVQATWSTGGNRAQFAYQASQDWGSSVAWAQELDSFGKGAYATAINTLESGVSQGVQSQSAVAAALQLDLGLIQQGQTPPLVSVLAALTENAPGVPANNAIPSQALGNSQIAAVVHKRASALHSNAVQQALLFGGLGALGMAIGLALVILVSRSVSRPLVDLAHQAEELASTTLPATVQAILDSGLTGGEPPKAPKVRVHSQDEVGLMAHALDAVNKTAVELAAGQANLRRNLADAFVNLGRRNQNLVTRQLEYISEIELKEADPESLEELFRLDHLATRMRRNAESLLILAGSGPARQWSASVPAMDVARAASAEVEDYKRLRLHHFDPAQITGSVTTDLVHIMAELIENALTFSPPGSPVDVYGRFLEGGYVIVIVDSGIGMSAEDLEVANRRLEGEGADGEVPGRYLGHFVAGRLASRHGISISLQASHSGGLVARVKIPASLIEDGVPDLSAGAELRELPGRGAIASLPAAPTVAATPAAPVGQTTSGISVIPDNAYSDNGHSDNGHSDSGYSDSGYSDSGYSDSAYSDSGYSGNGAGAHYAVPASEAAPAEAPAYGADPVADYYGAVSPDALSEALAQASAASSTEAYAADYELPADWSVLPAPPAQSAETYEPAGYEPADAYAATAQEEAPLGYEGAQAYQGPAEAPEAEAAGQVEARQDAPAQPVASAPAAEVARPQTPDLGVDAPLAAASRAGGEPAERTAAEPVLAEAVAEAAVGATATSGAGWSSLAAPEAAASAVGPAAQARSTADGLRRLTRRVPGASLPQEDDSLRRAKPTTVSRNPMGLTGALSQYLSATGTDARTEKEQK